MVEGQQAGTGCHSVTTTRKDFNMHRSTGVPQRTDFKCKYKSAVQAAELVQAMVGVEGVPMFAAGQLEYCIGRFVSHASSICVDMCHLCVCACVCFRENAEQSNYNSPLSVSCRPKSILEGTSHRV